MNAKLNADESSDGSAPDVDAASPPFTHSWRFRWHPAVRYLFAVILILIACCLTWILQSLDAPSFQTPFFVCAIVVSAWAGGFGPGIFATLLALAILDYTFTAPLYTFRFGMDQVPKFSVILVTGIGISWLARQQRRDEEALMAARAELEKKVQARTLDLRETNTKLVAEVAERRRAEKELQRLNRVWRVRSYINRSVTRSADEMNLLQNVCQTIVETGGYSIAWIGYARDGAITPAACATLSGTDDLAAVSSQNTRGYQLAARAVQKGRPVAFNQRDPQAGGSVMDDWAVAHDIKTVLALPLINDGAVVAILIVYSEDWDGFDQNETELLQQAANDVAQGIGVLRERAARAKAETALKKTESELARVARFTTMGELTASIAHEINQPLAALVTNANASLRWLAAEPPNFDQAKTTVQRIVRDGKRAAEVISRIRSLLSKGQGVRQKLNLNELLEETLPMVSGELERRQATLETEFAPHLPMVEADRVQIQQVIMNLMVNALDAMKEINDRPHILRIRTEMDGGGESIIAVQDSGIGIDAEKADQLFAAFYSTKPEGMGMGLSISRSIMEAHGGRLWAEPNSGPGATFKLSIPSCNGARS